ncbi:hypothetical protein Y032_0045g1113 [Ancylostoma ceylanicum]|uniref:Uncharacterized protein n=1 Tax=Ancylostoma ceylanicum TaxID=53326 RepID=A0A016UD12_9BILA|nr:hypothetical protein Y032_0045g1113 [Ancylostoma ceylanicum]
MAKTLLTRGNGLFDTHISWEDIERRIQEERKLNVVFGPKKSIHRIGEGIGFLSRIGVVNADFRGEADDLPSKFVVKMVCVLTGLEIAEAAKERHGNDADLKELYEGFDTNIKDLHNREVNVFRIFSRFDYSLSKIPRLYFAQDFTKENELKGDFYGLWI